MPPDDARAPTRPGIRSGGEVLRANGVEEVPELTDQLVRVGPPIVIGVLFIVLVHRQHDAFAVHEIVGHEERCPGTHGDRYRVRASLRMSKKTKWA